jgi:single-stranded DNA-binding protein
MSALAALSAVRVAGAPTFIPGETPTKNVCLFTVIENEKLRNGENKRTDISCRAWGKYANIVANFLCKGKLVNIIGRHHSYTKDTGTVDATGKAKINTDLYVTVYKIQLLTRSRKDLREIFDENIKKLKQAGKLPMELQLSYDDVIPPEKPMVDFNPAVSVKTGMYGHANVWTKDRENWKPTTAAATNTDATIRALQAQVTALMAEQNMKKANKTIEAGIDPF